MLGGTTTVKPTPLLATPPTVTTTLPVVAPFGTGATTLVALQLVGVPLNVTVLVPCVPPKFVPVIVTNAPTGPEVGERLAIVGAILPPAPLAALNAAIAAIQFLEGESVHVAAIDPAAPWTWSSSA